MDDQLTPTEFIRAAERARPANEAGFTGHRAAFHLMIARTELRRAKRFAQKANRRVAEWQEKVDVLADRARLWESRPRQM